MPGERMTPAAAIACRAALIRDREWSARYLAGGAAERRDLDTLQRISAGLPPEPSLASMGSPQQQAIARRTELLADREWVAKLNNGDIVARAELDRLQRLSTEEDDQ
jgi:hypothetical protein